jgi:hypothetical protein
MSQTDRIVLADGSAFDVTYDWDSGLPYSRTEPPQPPQLLIEKIINRADGKEVSEEFMQEHLPQAHEELTNKIWEIINGPLEGEYDEPDEDYEDE